MNKLPDANTVLAELGRLQETIREAKVCARQIEEDFAQRTEASDRQRDQAVRLAEARGDTARTEAEVFRGARRKELESALERRRERLQTAQAAALNHRLKSIASRESKQVFRVQRELLETSRERDTGLREAEAAREAFVGEWTAEQDAVVALGQSMVGALRGVQRFRRLLEALPEPPPVEPGADRALLEVCAREREETGVVVRRFRRRPAVLLFGRNTAWLALAMLAAAHAGVVLLWPVLGETRLEWRLAGISLLVTGLAFLAIRGLVVRLLAPSVLNLAQRLSRAYALLDAAEEASRKRLERDREKIQAAGNQRTTQLEREWNETLAEGERLRAAAKEALQRRLTKAVAKREAAYERALGRLDQELEERVRKFSQGVEEQIQRAEKDRQGRHNALEATKSSRWQELLTRWEESTRAAYAVFDSARIASDRHFPGWNDPIWDEWRPPGESMFAARFGTVRVDLERLAEGLPEESRLRLPGAVRFEVPLLLTFPEQGSLLMETEDWGRETALPTLNNLILRLLMAAPAGKALFTILDPVGLGQSFAGLMHLTDHEERLINRRIWTQPDQIEQRLADLSEHIEKVTQLYLRNEYPSLAEYNAQAGRIAEPYHFLVIADLPVHFSDLAIRRLLSIAASGPRCGVFTLVHWDQRRSAPADWVPEDLRKGSVELRAEGARFVPAKGVPAGLTIELDPPPDPGRFTTLLTQVGRSSVDSNRVEMPFAQIAPAEAARWTLDTSEEVRVPIGVTGATKLQFLALGKGTRQHALVAGKTGSGKSTLFHVLITNLALAGSPEAVEFYLVDFKKGVEFKCYATWQLPHARVVAIESDREFGLSVLQRVDAELQRRGDLFRKQGVQDLPSYLRAAPGARMPRTLLVVDEFQEFFTEDDRVGQQAALLLDRLVRQGRAFGIHVLLGSQTLGGAYTLARPTLGQMVVRIALQCNQADALLIMDEDNAAPRLLSRPGEGIYNDAAGAVEGNSPFQVAWLPEHEREVWLQEVRRRAEATMESVPEPFVFEGNAPAHLRENRALDRALRSSPSAPPLDPRIWIGAPNAIKGPTEVVWRRQSGSHLLVVGLQEEAVATLLSAGMIALAAQHPASSARFFLIDASPADSGSGQLFAKSAKALPQEVRRAGLTNLATAMADLEAELDQRVSNPGGESPAIYVVLHRLERFKELRYEEDFGIGARAEGPTPPGAVLNRILTEGASLGLHLLCTCDSYNSLMRSISRRALTEFDLRVLFQMSANDSANLMDDPRASNLGLHRGILYHAQQGTLETFRPYGPPSASWIHEVTALLGRRGATSAGSANVSRVGD